MPNFWDENANLYEQGGVAGARGALGVDPSGAFNNAMGGATAVDPNGSMNNGTPAFDPTAQVGHNGTLNGMNREQYRDAWMSSGAKSVPEMQAWLAQNGGVMTAANGTVMTPFGESLDMGGNAKGSMAGRGNLVTAWGGGGGPSGPSDGSLGAPAGGFVMNSGGGYGGGGGSYGGSGGGVQGGWDGEKFTASPLAMPTAYNPQATTGPDKFGGVSAADMAADPGVQFRLQQGNNALGNKFAASGLRGAGQAQAFADYNQNAASQEYGNVYNRKFGEYQAFTGANQQNQQFNAGRTDAANQNNFANAFAVGNANNQNAQAAWQGNTNAQLGQGNLNLGYTNAANTLGLGMANVGLGYHQADQSYALGQGNLALGYQNSNNAAGLGWANYGLNQQGQDFNQGYQLANMGLTAAGAYGNYAGQYGQNAGNYATGAGNAGAAGVNAGGQAWGQAFNGVGAAAAGAAGMYYGNRPQYYGGGGPAMAGTY